MSARPIIPIAATAPPAEGAACHSGPEQMRAAAAAAGKGDTLAQYARDYPVEAKGPHDQPQSMCPAFGSLRVGLRMRRTMTILSGSACCVYGLTFTSHFYGARRSVGYVPFNSESAGHRQAVRGHPRGRARAGRPRQVRRAGDHQPVRADRQRRAAAAAAEVDQRRAHHRHRRAGLRRAHACRGQGRAGRRDAALRTRRGRSRPGRARRAAAAAASRPSRCSARCSRPTR